MKILAYKGIEPISRVIQFVTRSQYSHVSFLDDDNSVWECVAAGCVHAASPSTNHKKGTPVEVFTCFGMRESDWTSARSVLRITEGKPYDYLGLLRFIHIDLETEHTSNGIPKSFFCSGHLEWVMAEIGNPLFDRTPHWKVPPDWIVRSPFLTKVDEFKTI